MISTKTERRAAKGRKALLTLGLLVAALVAACLLLAVKPAHTIDLFPVFTVNSTADEPDASAGDNSCATSGGACTLRAAIQEANATTVPDFIEFDIPGSGVQTISPATSLPVITEPVVIDGYTQPGATENTLAQPGKTNAVLKIQLRGPGTSPSVGLSIGIGVSNTTIRGLAIGNFDEGIVLIGSGDGNRVEGNFIGTDPTGTSPQGNTYGVHFSGTDASTIGGASPAARNLVSGNGGLGVWLEGGPSGNRIQGNLIGTDKNGTADLGNGGDGVNLSSSGPGNRILSNSIYSNGGLSIDLGGNGVTPNDSGDADTGPNNVQNFPAISSAQTSGGSTSIRGSLKSTPNETFILQFFSSPQAHLSGFGEGKKFIGQRRVTTDTAGNASFGFRPTRTVPVGQAVTATATDTLGNTSEFSRARGVVRG